MYSNKPNTFGGIFWVLIACVWTILFSKGEEREDEILRGLVDSMLEKIFLTLEGLFAFWGKQFTSSKDKNFSSVAATGDLSPSLSSSLINPW